MYQNITILDKTAFISFYDAKGIGDENLTIRCRRREKGREKTLYERIEQFFDIMWDQAFDVTRRKAEEEAKKTAKKKASEVSNG
jgi:hypothetical protein